MIPVCCICGKSAPGWHNKEWEDVGGLQDFCPEHTMDIEKKYGSLTEYCVYQ